MNVKTMKTVKVRGVELGAGAPKTIVPIVGKTREAILQKARDITALPAELVEWRADFYEDVLDRDRLLDTLKALRAELGELPLLFTLRTKPEGGEIPVDTEQYTALNLAVAESGDADMIDVEIIYEPAVLRANIDGIHRANCLVVGSKHDFRATPPKDEIVSILRRAQDEGADIPKIAVMPQCAHDVIMLLCASCEMHEKYADRPILTISMGPLGMISRVACELSGSCMTFGAAGQTSAPGQIQVGDLKNVLTLVHTASQAQA